MNNQMIDIDEMLANEVQTNIEEGEYTISSEGGPTEYDITEKNADYEYIYSGKAMIERELMHFSSRKTVRMVLVAGPFESGKTTLMVMMYHLFREGLNQKIMFKSSRTMKGFWERSEKLLLNSGNKKPKVDRTPRSAQDLFLNLELTNENGQVHNLIFTDISGELFSDQDFLKDLPDFYLDSKNIILVMDGAAMGDASKRRAMTHEIKIMADNLLKYGIMTRNTNLQVVCTKMDRVIRQNGDTECEQYINKKYEEMKETYGQHVAHISLQLVSALNLDDETECKNLERIIEKCMEKDYVESKIKKTYRRDLNRSFERYGLKE